MIDVFLQEGFEEIEAMAPVDILRRAGAKVVTVGEGGRTVTGAHGVRVEADLSESEVSGEDVGMVVLPGGPGTKNHEKSQVLHRVLTACSQSGKYIAAICAAPSVLGHMGLLAGHDAVCYPGYEPELGASRVLHVPVCVSGRIITARGPGVSIEFALKLVEVLYGPEKSRRIREDLQCAGVSAC